MEGDSCLLCCLGQCSWCGSLRWNLIQRLLVPRFAVRSTLVDLFMLISDMISVAFVEHNLNSRLQDLCWLWQLAKPSRSRCSILWPCGPSTSPARPSFCSDSGLSKPPTTTAHRHRPRRAAGVGLDPGPAPAWEACTEVELPARRGCARPGRPQAGRCGAPPRGAVYEHAVCHTSSAIIFSS